MKLYRHGDVIIKEVQKVLGEKQNVQKVTLAYGEVTGHSHYFKSGLVDLYKFNEKVYIEVNDDLACLTHEEHRDMKIPQGPYEIVIQQDYEPDGWKKVID